VRSELQRCIIRCEALLCLFTALVFCVCFNLFLLFAPVSNTLGRLAECPGGLSSRVNDSSSLIRGVILYWLDACWRFIRTPTRTA
jgi:hypothetical protein